MAAKFVVLIMLDLLKNGIQIKNVSFFLFSTMQGEPPLVHATERCIPSTEKVVDEPGFVATNVSLNEL